MSCSTSSAGPPRRARRGRTAPSAALPGRSRGAPAGAHRLRRRAALQGRDHPPARRAGAAQLPPTAATRSSSRAAWASCRAARPTLDAAALRGVRARAGRAPTRTPTPGSPSPSTSACCAKLRARAGGGLPHRLRGRLRRAPRRRGGRDRRGGRARGGARAWRDGHAAAVPRHPHQVVRRRMEARAAPARSSSSSTRCSPRRAGGCPTTSWSRCPRSRSPSSRGRWCACSSCSSSATACRRARCGWS